MIVVTVKEVSSFYHPVYLLLILFNINPVYLLLVLYYSMNRFSSRVVPSLVNNGIINHNILKGIVFSELNRNYLCHRFSE